MNVIVIESLSITSDSSALEFTGYGMFSHIAYHLAHGRCLEYSTDVTVSQLNTNGDLNVRCFQCSSVDFVRMKRKTDSTLEHFQFVDSFEKTQTKIANRKFNQLFMPMNCVRI